MPHDAQFIGTCEPGPVDVFTGVECVPMVGCSCVGADCEDLVPPDPVANPCDLAFQNCFGVQRSCDDIDAAYEEYASRNACDSDADCSFVFGHCGVGIGGCFYGMNRSWPAAGLQTLANEWVRAGCDAPVCECPEVPANTTCVNGACVVPFQ